MPLTLTPILQPTLPTFPVLDRPLDDEFGNRAGITNPVPFDTFAPTLNDRK